MDASHPIEEFHALPAAAQIETLVRLAHELTILGRDTYEVSLPGLRHPHRLRCLNELQHRVISHIRALLAADPGRYPDNVLVSIILEQDESELGRQIAEAFVRSLSRQAAVP